MGSGVLEELAENRGKAPRGKGNVDKEESRGGGSLGSETGMAEDKEPFEGTLKGPDSVGAAALSLA